MTQGDVLYVFGDALYLVVLGVAVLILPSLLVGLVVSVFQAATQINEQTLSFLPRLLATLVTIMALGPWLLGQMVDAFQELMLMIPGLIG
ncbi:MAG: flagellar biosynthetic protein FliQ [Pseudomonadales bacterium]